MPLLYSEPSHATHDQPPSSEPSHHSLSFGIGTLSASPINTTDVHFMKLIFILNLQQRRLRLVLVRSIA
jgi:hypothetical protein